MSSQPKTIKLECNVPILTRERIDTDATSSFTFKIKVTPWTAYTNLAACYIVHGIGAYSLAGGLAAGRTKDNRLATDYYTDQREPADV